MITQQDYDRSISFDEFYQLSETLVKNKDTTGENKSEAYVNYTKLSFKRMKRILKTTAIKPEVKNSVSNIQKPITLLILNESWCGDAAQSIPVIEKMIASNPNVNIRFLIRDENLHVMDQYLTNGSRSIPKLIALDENLTELGTWGPQPQFLNDWYKTHQENPTMEIKELKEQFQLWYNKDKGITLQKEIVELLQLWTKGN